MTSKIDYFDRHQPLIGRFQFTLFMWNLYTYKNHYI